MDYQKQIEQYLEEHLQEYADAAFQIHELAELSTMEEKSAVVLEDLLEKHGFAVERGLKDQPTAFRAVYGNGPVRIGYMCEYDALATLNQENDNPCQAGNGQPGHGCGHNLLGVGSAAAGIALKQLVDDGLPATIVVYGTPAEETLEGKTIMVANGYFRDVDVVLAWHPLDRNDPGEWRFKAVTAMIMNFHGKAAHACNCPELGRSALDAAELTNVGVNYLREHVNRDCYMHYSYLNGGDRPNIVPEKAKLWYMVRALTYKDMLELRDRVMKVAQGACMMTDTTVDFEIIGDNHDSKMNYTLCKLAEECMHKIGAPHFTEEDVAFAAKVAENAAVPGMTGAFAEQINPATGCAKNDNGSSDVADVSQIVPTVNINTSCYCAKTPNHTWTVTVQVARPAAYKGMLFASKTLALMAARLVTEPALLEAVKHEFEAAE